MIMNDRFPYFEPLMFRAGSYDQFLDRLSDLPVCKKSGEKHLFEYKIWKKYENRPVKSVENTFKYLFYKFKKGIFVQIRNNELVTFLPFSNEDYVNEWSCKIKTDPKKYKSVKQLVDKVHALKNYKPVFKLKPVERWMMNDPLVRYDTPKTVGLGHHVDTIKHMLEKLCELKTDVPDIDFFLNQRDFPLLKEDSTEPYQHIFSTSRQPLLSHDYSSYCPVLSMVTANQYADVPIPTYDCWIRAWSDEKGETKEISYVEPIKINLDWNSKLSKAVFRGSSTGAGVTVETNQRLKVCLKLAKERPDLIDAGITKWNLRPRKHKSSKYLETIEINDYSLADFISPQEQADRYKYVLCLEGHVAAFRISREMTYGCTLLLTETPYKMWFVPYLKPWVHYVPVAYDCSDLIDRIEWCKTHDDECKKIAETALQFVKEELTVDKTLDYLKYVLTKLSVDYVYPVNIIKEQNRLIEEKFAEIVFTEGKFPYDVPDMYRTAGYLDGTRLIFNGCPVMKKKKSLKCTNFLEETLYVFNNVECVERKYYDPVLTRYEAYLGLYAFNKCCSKIPNFTYVYGISPVNPDAVYLEYVEAPSLKEWLNGPEFTITELIILLCQISCALKEAEMTAGIRHFDLTPETVKVKKLESPVELHYHDGRGKIISIKVQNLALIDSYYRASAVIYCEETDAPFIFRRCDFEEKSYSDSDLIGLIAEIPYLKDIVSFKYKSFGSHWSYRYKSSLDPVKLALKYKLNDRIKYSGEPYKSLSEYGPLPRYVYYLAEKGRHDSAIKTALQRIIKNPPPRSDNAFMQAFVKNILDVRFAWTARFGLNHKKVYEFLNKQPPAITGFPQLVWPSISDLGEEVIGFPKYVSLTESKPPIIDYFEPVVSYDVSGPTCEFIDILYRCCVKNLLIGEVKRELIKADPYTLHYVFANYAVNHVLKNNS
ncbi:putative lipopolysaccharide-modifying enzyme protein [Lymphocystis disease virus 4]|uniref:Putative lipopolysaccharide-modifying enzyme protein n=1 Tax=Lymphocystis disease virus 4 TaxID=2704413 RepID=A0A6B9XMT6_9VIRU|nr:putative lipopolysaccharide-modifying enzyme protein [Lymphocystis disease virus 4]QHR78438.1 putative lipopolysaccharide-modifying enzyme protein [Lymphocystis disease virus 4]